MSNSTTHNSNELVPESWKKQLVELQQALTATTKNMESLLKPLAELNEAFSTSQNSYKQTTSAIDQFNSIQKKVTRSQTEHQKTLVKIQRLEERISTAYSKESLELERLRGIMRDITRTRRNLVKEQNSQTGSTEKLRSQMNLLLQAYDKMSAKMHRSPIGKQVLDDIKRLNKEITELESTTGRKQRNVGNYMTKMGTAMSVFAGNVASKLLGVFGAFAKKAFQFAVEATEVAAKAEGITQAFTKLDSPDLLKNLREETRGLVSDLQLMTTAVRAENFDIPLEHLGKLLKFAQQRSIETGESVDYLVKSIVDGIGRKSSLVLDNLGISASRLQAKVKETGDFTASVISIVNEELEQQGDVILPANTLATVKWENATLKMGQALLGIRKFIDKIRGGFADQVSIWAGQIAKLTGATESANKAFNDQLTKVAKLNVETVPLINKYEELSKKIKLNYDQTKELNPEQDELLSVIDDIREAIPGVVTEFDKYGRAIGINTGKAKEFIRTQIVMLKYMNRDAIAELEDNIKEYTTRVEMLKKTKEEGKYEEYVGGSNFSRGTRVYREYTPEELEFLDGKLATEIKRQTEAQEELERLNGQTLENLLKSSEAIIQQRNDFNAMNKKQLKKWIEDEKNAQSEFKKIAEDVYKNRFATTTDEDESGDTLNSKGGLSTPVDDKGDRDRKAQTNIRIFEAEQKGKELQAIIKDTKASYETRIQMLNDFVDTQKETIRLKTEKELSDMNLSNKEKELIELKGQQELINVDKQASKTRIQIAKDVAEQQAQALSMKARDKGRDISLSESDAQAQLSALYAEGLISTQTYEDERTRIARDAAEQRFKAEIELMQALLDIENLEPSKRQSIEQQIAETRIAYAKYANDIIIEENEKTSRKIMEQERKLADARKRLITESLRFISTVFSAGTENQLDELDERREQEQTYFDERKDEISKLEEFGAITKEEANARKAIVDQDERKRMKEMEQEQVQIKRRQAKFDKAIAVTQILIDTSRAIMKAVAASPLTFGMPFTAFIGATSAIQLATVAAQPLPKYKDGTDDHKGGFAITGDGGKSELVVYPDGRMMKTPSSDTLVYLPEHTKVFPDYEKAMEQMSLQAPSIPLLRPAESERIIVSENKKQIALSAQNNSLMGGVISGQGAIVKAIKHNLPLNL